MASTAFAQSGEKSEVEGIITARKGDILLIESGPGELPGTGVRSNLSKHFTEKLGKMEINGWMGVALVETLDIDPQSGGRPVLRVRIIRETSTITVNDEPVDHFKPGKRVKLAWPATEQE